MLFLAGGIFCLHNVLPHEHLEEEYSFAESSSSQKDCDSLLDWLKFIFQNDIGNGHLEYFQSTSDLDFQDIAIAFTALNPTAFFTEEITNRQPDRDNVSKDFFYPPLILRSHLPGSSSHRGPPANS